MNEGRANEDVWIEPPPRFDFWRSRPTLAMAALAAIGAVATMAAGIALASIDSTGSFREWLVFAGSGFELPVQLCLLSASLLLVIDFLSSPPFSGQRAAFAALAFVGAVGVVADLGAMVAAFGPLTSLGNTRVAEARATIVLVYLAPAMLAALVVWLSVRASRGSIAPQRSGP